jgi:tRNA(fMet)-specific endonuclease VapC
MGFLLDTNAVIAALNESRGPVARRMMLASRESLHLSSISLHELYFGAFRSARQRENLGLVERLGLTLLDFGREEARLGAELRAVLVGRGTPIGPLDVLIAGHALARGLTVVTNNTREFRRVPGLRVEDWSAG